jgi:hypothetical protein
MCSALVVFLTGYVSLWQPALFDKALEAETASSSIPVALEPVLGAPPGERPKYQRNRLDAQEAKEYAQKLVALMDEDRAYRDGSLTLQTFADTLGTTPHVLSQVLNVHIGRSFYDFVNSYRVEALKTTLSGPPQRSWRSRARHGGWGFSQVHAEQLLQEAHGAHSPGSAVELAPPAPPELARKSE